MTRIDADDPPRAEAAGAAPRCETVLEADALTGHDLAALQRLDLVCRQIARGEYDRSDDLFQLTIDVHAAPVIRDLAESFGSMLVQVEARQFHLAGLVDELRALHEQLEQANRQLKHENSQLSQEVRKLTVEIDRRQFRREVGQITESEYFQELQRRARLLRTRRRLPAADAPTPLTSLEPE